MDIHNMHGRARAHTPAAQIVLYVCVKYPVFLSDYFLYADRIENCDFCE